MDYNITTDTVFQNMIKANMMGPNAITLLEELSKDLLLKKGMKVLDLGCGRGITSIYLAKKFGVTVYAVDLWTSATENYERFKEAGVEELIIPLQFDALNLPFADRFFDAVVSVDSYHYFANNDFYFQERLLTHLKQNAIIAITTPAMKVEITDNILEEMKEYWDNDILTMIRPLSFWKPKFIPYIKELRVTEMECSDKAWESWLSTENPYAISDRAMMKADNGRFMTSMSVIGFASHSLIIREEAEKDFDAVYNVCKEAFLTAEHSDGAEQDLVVKLRKSEAFVPELSLVAEIDGEIVGHIMFTKLKIGDKTALALAPLSVSPAHQKKGIGTALIQKGHVIAKELGYTHSVLLGSPGYYPKFGYKTSTLFGINSPFEVPADYFMAVKLTDDDIIFDGAVEYAKEFFE